MAGLVVWGQEWMAWCFLEIGRLGVEEMLDRVGMIAGVKGSESLIHLSTKFDRAV